MTVFLFTFDKQQTEHTHSLFDFIFSDACVYMNSTHISDQTLYSVMAERCVSKREHSHITWSIFVFFCIFCFDFGVLAAAFLE
jgi:hypothetical protein